MANVVSDHLEAEELEAEETSQPLTSPASIEASPPDDLELPSDWVNQPEALIYLAFIALLTFWQAYLVLTQEADAENFLSNRGLAQRLGVSYSTISRRRSQEDFTEWSRSRDPDGVGWIYGDRKFLPIYPTSPKIQGSL